MELQGKNWGEAAKTRGGTWCIFINRADDGWKIVLNRRNCSTTGLPTHKTGRYESVTHGNLASGAGESMHNAAPTQSLYLCHRMTWKPRHFHTHLPDSCSEPRHNKHHIHRREVLLKSVVRCCVETWTLLMPQRALDLRNTLCWCSVLDSSQLFLMYKVSLSVSGLC